MYSIVDRDLQNDKRTAVEEALMRGGLVQTAGGTRYRYFGKPGQGVTGVMIRVGVKAFRIVKRFHGSGGIIDAALDREHFYGKVDLRKLEDLAARMSGRMDQIETAAVAR